MELVKKKRVYHFINREYGISAIRDRKLKISTLPGLNDPFELLAHNVQDRNIRKFLNMAKKQFSDEFGIICFSRDCTSPVQWAHYADRNKGLCLGFDVSVDLLRSVFYVDQRFDKFNFPDEGSEEEWAGRVLGTKFSQWSYEQEVRIFAELKDQHDGLYFKGFDDFIVLKEVQVGFDCSITRSELSELLRDYPEVKSFKVRPAFSSFEMIENKDADLWK